MGIVRISLKDLRNILKEEILLEAGKGKDEESGEDSLDSQIDRYLNSYEKEAKSLKQEGLDWNRTVRRLLEADDEEEAGDEEDEDIDLEGDEEEEEPEEPPPGTIEDIDVGSFVNDVMRLVDNYDSLLEVRNTILRRASNFLNKNYESDVVDSFNESLRSEYGIEIGKTDDEYAAEKFTAPVSDRAGGGGGSS